jgi:hypothetical protein
LKILASGRFVELKDGIHRIGLAQFRIQGENNTADIQTYKLTVGDDSSVCWQCSYLTLASAMANRDIEVVCEEKLLTLPNAVVLVAI